MYVPIDLVYDIFSIIVFHFAEFILQQKSRTLPCHSRYQNDSMKIPSIESYSALKNVVTVMNTFLKPHRFFMVESWVPQIKK